MRNKNSAIGKWMKIKYLQILELRAIAYILVLAASVKTPRDFGTDHAYQ
jgi:hypothetical protein